MKKRMVLISAVLIGISYFSSETVALADEIENGINNSVDLLEKYSTADFPKDSVNLFEAEEKNFDKQIPNLFHIKEKKESEETKQLEMEEAENDASEIKDLQIPQRLEVVIDPWELDGKSQIYSETYVIKNAGESDGVLTLSELTCKPCADSKVNVLTEKENLHDNEEKSVYMEMVFGNGEQIVLLETGTEYKVQLKPGEEISFYFTGEVNEYAADRWKNGDVEIGVVYSWNIGTVVEDTVAEESLSAEDQESGQAVEVSEQEEEEPEADLILDEDENKEESEEDNYENEGEPETNDASVEAGSITDNPAEHVPLIDELVQEFSGNGQRKCVDLQMIQKAKVLIDSWIMDENGWFVSEEYVLQNSGELVGTLVLSDLMCLTDVQNEAIVRSNEEEMRYAEDKSVNIELISSDGKQIILSQDCLEYKVELKPDEELGFRFVREINMSEDGEDRNVKASVLCSWHIEDEEND